MKYYQAEVDRISDGVERFFAKTFTKVHVEGPELDNAKMRSSRVLIACTHRSQTDYFMAGYLLYKLGIERMRFAAGENLTRLPYIGPRFKKLGAFPIRRSRTLGRDYVRNLCEQVVEMLASGDQIVVFPEGGRSYEGNMMEIRGGILNAGMISQIRDTSKDVLVLPISFSYECLPELRYFRMLLKGKHMRRGGQGFFRNALGNLMYFGADAIAFSKFLVARRFGVRYGAVYVDYGELVPVRSVVDLEKDIVEGARNDFSACRIATQKLSLEIYDRFNALYRLLPSHVLARVLVDNGPLSTEGAAPLCVEWVKKLEEQGRNVRSIAPMDEALLVQEGIAQLRRHKAVRIRKGRIAIVDQAIVRYYAASVV
jgi:1-acyl-sn-glycerol-3-phosphate acyltransferase